MKTEIVKIEANNLMELLETIMSGKFDEQLKETPSKKENPVKLSTSYTPYIESIASRLRCNPKKVANIISTLWEIYPIAAFSVLLREIAITLDKNYEDHISNCKEFYIISPMDGRIHKACRANVKNFRNFAAFRTLEDAKIACRILKEDLKDMFKFCGK